MLHHTGAGSDINLVKYLALNKAQVSVHYVVGRDGTIYQLADDDRVCWHAGVSSWDGKENLNRYSIGIEICSEGVEFTGAQRDSVRELVEYLMQKYGISKENIIRHKDVAPGRKVDVADSFWDNSYKTRKDYQDSYGVKSDEDISKDMGIRNGERPNEFATRQEVATMIGRFINLSKNV